MTRRSHILLCSSGDGGAGAMAKQQAQQQKAVQDATNQINQAFSGFNDAFYNENTQKQENALLPGFQQQEQQTSDQLGFNLVRKGQQNSSQAKKLGESFGTEVGKQKQNIANQALQSTNQLKQNVNQQQQNLITEAGTANNPGSVAAQALGTASSFAAPSLLAPVAGVFNNWANMYLGQQNNQTYNTGTNAYNSMGTTPSYGSSFSSLTTGK